MTATPKRPATVRVIAQQTGFFNGHRVKALEEFDMPGTALKPAPAVDEMDGTENYEIIATKAGEIVDPSSAPVAGCEYWALPSWVRLAGPGVKAEIIEGGAARERKFAAAAIASSGSKGNAKKRTFVEQIRGGGAPMPKAAQGAIDASGGPAARAKAKHLREASAQADIPIIETQE